MEIQVFALRDYLEYDINKNGHSLIFVKKGMYVCACEVVIWIELIYALT